MKIFTAEQIKKWDAYTIAHEPIASINLMERAATACCKWLIGKNFGLFHYRLFFGKGNNRGDGLALARMLIKHNCAVTVYILEFGNIGTDDFQTNLARLHTCSTDIHFIQSADFFPSINDSDIVIDALFGTGLNKPLEGISKALVEHINQLNGTIISIDLPSGLYADKSSVNNPVIHAAITLSFQHYKLAFLLPENEVFFGDVHLLDIGLLNAFEKNEPAVSEMIEHAFIRAAYKPRSKFAHKGTFGHAALLCGSYGMIGAAVLASKACLRSGVGKLTVFIPKCGYTVLQTTAPEAMCMVAGEDYLISAPGIEKCNAVGIGPGIGIHATHKELLLEVFKNSTGQWLLTHPGEFERLFGASANDFERLELARKKALERNLYILLKGHYSFISTPGGIIYFNSTGNSGMATGGSGDVLTGIITGLLAQGYTPLGAAQLGVYIHGLAGDHAVNKYGSEAMIAGDIINNVGNAFKDISIQIR
ncbi:MAG: NAD(P)H-hydrate epimerase [Chitinophagaceae bacterium]|nr:NAD(P)H-hydrate epimerase [Chitinophagaceae bacterium]